MDKVVPHATLVQALHSPELVELLPGLIRYAESLLGRMGSTVLAEDAVQNAIMSSLRGQRHWLERLSFRSYLHSVVFSWVSYMRRAAKLRVGLDDFVESAAPSSRRNDVIDARALVEALEEEIADDEDQRALYRLLADSDRKMTWAEQGEALTWSSARVRSTHARLKRRFEAVCLRRQGQDDESPEGDRSPPDLAPPAPCARRRAAG